MAVIRFRSSRLERRRPNYIQYPQYGARSHGAYRGLGWRQNLINKIWIFCYQGHPSIRGPRPSPENQVSSLCLQFYCSFSFRTWRQCLNLLRLYCSSFFFYNNFTDVLISQLYMMHILLSFVILRQVSKNISKLLNMIAIL